MQNTNTPNNLPASPAGGPAPLQRRGAGPAQKTPPQGKKLWLFVLILVMLLIIIGVTYKIMLREPSDSTSVPGYSIPQAEDSSLPSVFYSYRGIIKEISPEEIIIEAKADGYFLMQDIQVRVLLDKETSFVKKTIPQRVGEVTQEELAELFRKENIQFDDLSLGDEIMAVADENVKGKTEFTATRIEVQIIQ